MPNDRKADRLQEEAGQIRERAAFYAMEAEFGPPPPIAEAKLKAARLTALAERVEAEAKAVLQSEGKGE